MSFFVGILMLSVGVFAFGYGVNLLREDISGSVIGISLGMMLIYFSPRFIRRPSDVDMNCAAGDTEALPVGEPFAGSLEGTGAEGDAADLKNGDGLREEAKPLEGPVEAAGPRESVQDRSEKIISQLERLQSLRERGALTDEEFEAQKRRLLSSC